MTVAHYVFLITLLMLKCIDLRQNAVKNLTDNNS